MREFEVRRAHPSDAGVIADLNRYVHEDHVAAEPEQFHSTDPSELERFFERELALPDHIAFIAAGSRPLGYVWAQELDRPRNEFANAIRLIYIHHLAVAPPARRLGVATALCRAVEEEAARRGIRDAALDHWTFNVAAAEFFKRAGFSDFNVRMRKRLG